MARDKWRTSPEYQRILEILADYWLSVPDELKVRVKMDFVKANGETQSKCITWSNPDYRRNTKREGIIPLANIDKDYIKRREADFWSATNYVKIK